MNEIYLIGAARTAVGSFNGSLASLSAIDLGRIAVEEVLRRSGVRAAEVDEVLLGCVLQAGLGQNVARQVAIKAGIPAEKTAMTINMVCGSGLRAIAAAAQEIKADDASMIVAGGTESMSQAPYLLRDARTGYRMGDGSLVDEMIYDGLWEIFNGYHMGLTAENLAAKFDISRADQDALACASQNRAITAIEAGRFKAEIVPVRVPQKKGDPIVVDRGGISPIWSYRRIAREAQARLQGGRHGDGRQRLGYQ